MKFALILAAVFSVNCAYAQNAINAKLEVNENPFVIKSYEPVNLPVSLTNESDVITLEFNINLPDALEFADGASTEAIASDRLNPDDHSVYLNPKNGKVVVTPNTNKPIKGNEGVILYIPVKVTDGYLETAETVDVKFSNIVFAGAGGVTSKQDSFVAKVSLEPYTYKAYLEPSPLEILPSTPTQVSLCLDNYFTDTLEPAPVSGMTIDMYLPEGLTVVDKSIKINNERLYPTTTVTYETNMFFISSILSDVALKEDLSTGVLFTFEVVAAEDFNAGENGTEITLENLVVSPVAGAWSVEGECENCPVINGLIVDPANQAAYDEVIEKIDALQAEYEEALAASKEAYPDYDFSEYEEIITNAINEAKKGAAQALRAATEDNVPFSYPFDGEEIQNMIADMKVAPTREELQAANQAAYDEVIAAIDALQAEYEAALAEAKEANPEYNFSEYEEIISNAISEAKSGASQALQAANDDVVEFFYPFDGEEIQNMINDMKNAPAREEIQAANKAAYDKVIADIDALEAEYEAALAEAKEANPEYNFSEYEEIISNAISEAKSGATQALQAANDDAVEFFYPFDGEEIQNMINDMKNAPAQEALQAANKAAYDKVIAEVDALEAEYEAALAEAKEAYPDYDFSEYEEIISNAINEAKSGAEQALQAATDDAAEFFFPFDGEEIRNMINDMKNAPAQEDLQAANKAAYEKVIADIDALEAEYEAALAEAKEAYPDYDFSEYEEIITNAISEAKSGAEQALQAATDDAVEFFFPFDGEEIRNIIADMKTAPTRDDLQAANQAAYDKVMADVDALETEYESTLATVKEAYPDYDFSEYEEIISNAINEAKTGAAQALDSANEDGVEFSFPFNGEEIQNMIADMKAAPAREELQAANQAAYDKVIADVDALETEYESTLAIAKETYPDYDFSEYEEIISNAINEAKSGAAQALDSANEDGVEFSFPFDGEEIRNMIADMKAAPAREELQAANKAAYEEVMNLINKVEVDFYDALAASQEAYPEYNFSEYEEIISNAINEAKSGAAQALESANEDEVAFFFPFDAEEIQNMIADMKIAPAREALEADNQAAYDKVMAEVDALEAEYESTLTMLKEANPDYDFSEWEEIIGGAIKEAQDGAASALEAANEDGVEFSFPFDGEDIRNMIKEMEKDVELSGINAIEAEAAEGKAMIFTLDGKQHKSLVRGEVNIIVRPESTSKMFIK